MATEGIRNADLELNKVENGMISAPKAVKPKDPTKNDPPKWAVEEAEKQMSGLRTFAENPFQYYGLAFSTKEAIEPKHTHIVADSRYDPSTGINLSNDVLKDIRAASQSNASKLANGLGKFAITAGTSFIENTGYLYNVALESLYNLVDENDDTTLASAWSSNVLSRWGADVRERAEKWMPHYRDSTGKGNWADFLGDQVLKTAGFMVGMVSSAVVPGGSMGTFTRLGARGVGRLVLGASKNLAKTKKASRFTAEVLGSLHGAMAEAAVESVTGANDWEKSHIMDLDDKLRRGEITQSEYDERRDFLKSEKVKMGNAIFVANVPYLTVSNYIPFGRALGGKYTSAARFMQQLKKGSINEMKKNWAKPAAKGVLDAALEGFEEMNQRVFQTTAGIAAEEDYNRYFRNRNNYKAQNFTNMFLGSMMKGITDTYTDSSAWEEFAMGALIGFTGAPVLQRVDVKQKDGTVKKDAIRVRWAGGIPNEIITYNKDVDYTNDRIRAINERLKNMEPYYRNLIMKAAASEDMNIASLDKDKFDFKNAEFMDLISDIALFNEVGKKDILKDMVREWGLDEQQSVDDILQAGYAELASNTEYDKNVKSVFFDKHGNARNRDEVVAKIKATQDNILKLIDEYSEVRDELEYDTDGALDSEQLSHLTWMRMQVGNWHERAQELYDSGLKTVIADATNQYISALTKEKEAKIKKNESTEQEDESIKLLEDILTLSEDSDKLGILLAKNPDIAAALYKQVSPENRQDFDDYIRANVGAWNFTEKVREYVENPKALQDDLAAEYRKIVEQQTDSELNRVTEIYSQAPSAHNAFAMLEHLEQSGIYDSEERVLQKLRESKISTSEFEEGVKRYHNYKKFSNQFDKVVDFLSEKYGIDLYTSQTEKDSFEKFVRDRFFAGFDANAITLELFGENGPIERAKNNILIKTALQEALRNAKVAEPDNTSRNQTPEPTVAKQTKEEKEAVLPETEKEIRPKDVEPNEGTIEDKKKKIEEINNDVREKEEELTQLNKDISDLEKSLNSPNVEELQKGAINDKINELKTRAEALKDEIDTGKENAANVSNEVIILQQVSAPAETFEKIERQAYEDAEYAPVITEMKDTNTVNPDASGVQVSNETDDGNPYQTDGDANVVTNWRGFDNLEYNHESLEKLHIANEQRNAFIDGMRQLNAFDFVNKGLLANLVAFNRKKGIPTKVHIVASFKNKALWTKTKDDREIPRKLLAVEIPDGFRYTGKTVEIDGKQYQIVGELGGRFTESKENDALGEHIKQAGHEINTMLNKFVTDQEYSDKTDWVICKNTWNYVRKIYGGRFVKAKGTSLGSPIRNAGDVLKGDRKLREASSDSHQLMVVSGDKDATLYYDSSLNIHNLNRFARSLKGSVWLLTKQSDNKWYPRYCYVKTASEWFNDISGNTESNAVYREIDNLCRKICNAAKDEDEAGSSIYRIMRWIYFGPVIKDAEGNSVMANKLHLNQNKKTGEYVIRSNAFLSNPLTLTGNLENDVAELKKRLFDKSSNFRMNVSMFGVTDSAYSSAIIKSDVLKTDLLQVENANASFDMFPEYAYEENRKNANDAEIIRKNEDIADDTYADPEKYSNPPVIYYNGKLITMEDIENLPEMPRNNILSIINGVAKSDKEHPSKGSVYHFDNNGEIVYYSYRTDNGIQDISKEEYDRLAGEIEGLNSNDSASKVGQVFTKEQLFGESQNTPATETASEAAQSEESDETSKEPSYEQPVKTEEKPEENIPTLELLTEEQRRVKNVFSQKSLSAEPNTKDNNIKSTSDIINELKNTDKYFPFFDYMFDPRTLLAAQKVFGKKMTPFEIYMELDKKIKENKISQERINAVKDISTFTNFLNNINCI